MRRVGLHDFQVVSGAGDDMRATVAKRTRAQLAGIAAYLLAAMAFIDPALAGECEETAAALREAAQEANLSAEALASIETGVDRALASQAAGDQIGCLSRLAELRQFLQRV